MPPRAPAVAAFLLCTQRTCVTSSFEGARVGPWLQHLNEQADDVGQRVELPTAPALRAGEAAEEVFVDPARACPWLGAPCRQGRGARSDQRAGRGVPCPARGGRS